MTILVRSGTDSPSPVTSGKIVLKSLVVCAVLLPATARLAQAAVVRVNGESTYTGSNASVLQLLGANSTVTTSVEFNLGPGTTLSSPPISGVSGTFSWDNGGTHVFNVSNVGCCIASSSGEVRLNFLGSGPTVNGFTADRFIIGFDVGTNPFSSSEDLSTLLLGSSVTRMRVGAHMGSGTSFDDINSNVSARITPEPAAIALLSLGALAMVCRRRRRA